MAHHNLASARKPRFRLHDRLLALIVAASAKMMLWLSILHAVLQRIGRHAVTDFGQLVPLLLSIPCFKLGYFFFKLSYRVQQLRLRRLGRYCAALGGHDFSREFENLRLDQVGVVNIFHGLRDFHTERSEIIRPATALISTMESSPLARAGRGRRIG